ncbi:MAG: serine--tRNA ligase [Bacteroidales bacterium]|nr:serine--tRNA ligase [Bacteroidales bacterium]
MLQANYIKENNQEVIERLAIKNFTDTDIIDKIILLDNNRKEIQKKLDDNLAESKSIAKEIGILFKTGKTGEANQLKQKTGDLKKLSKELSEQLDKTSKDLKYLLLEVPNLPHSSVPKGNSEDDNKLVFEEGDFPKLPSNALPHWELAKKYDIINFELGSKVTGAGFPFYKGKGARLQRALINFFLDEALKEGYLEYQPPLLINEASGYGTGQLPDKDDQMYHIGIDNFYLIPTAEVPITNIYRDTIHREGDFPIKNVAYSSCFRREAGSYGKDVRGLNRLHQFDKVEIVQIQHPEKSYQTLEDMKEYVSSLIRKLELPFRISILCGGDMSFTSALTYDFEVYSAAQKKWLEVSSVSNFESFQANRMKLRFKDKNGKTRLAHTLNGSALALPRIVAALLENNQSYKGIKIPKVLVDYTGFEIIS